jgi:hypothetical protein
MGTSAKLPNMAHATALLRIIDPHRSFAAPVTAAADACRSHRETHASRLAFPRCCRPPRTGIDLTPRRDQRTFPLFHLASALRCRDKPSHRAPIWLLSFYRRRAGVAAPIPTRGDIPRMLHGLLFTITSGNRSRTVVLCQRITRRPGDDDHSFTGAARRFICCGARWFARRSAVATLTAQSIARLP